MTETMSSTSPGRRLDLHNLNSAEAERSHYVLTSPRSLQSCARLGIKPVKLLIKSLNELLAERNDLPFEAVRVMHESYENERRRLLRTCQEERERIIQAAKWSSGNNQDSGLEVATTDYSRDRRKVGATPRADLRITGKSVSTSCSATGERHPDRSPVCSLGLGDFKHSLDTQMKLEKLTRDINKEMCVTVSERDRKIAALMLVKHQEEQFCLKLCQQTELGRQEARRREEAQRAQAEEERIKKLQKSMQRWHDELQERRRMRDQREADKVGLREQEVQMQEERWRRLKEELETRRKENIEAAQKEAWGRKHCQEKILREKEEVEKRRQECERQAAVEREQKAKRSKVSQVEKKRGRMKERNRQEMLRHVLLKQQVEQQVEEEEVYRRSELDRKLRHSCEMRAQAAEARQKEVQQRALQGNESIQKARRRAELQRAQQLKYKETLVQLSQRRMERAALHASTRSRDRARRTQERNNHRQRCHRILREKMQREEEEARKVREHYVSVKECRRERLRRQREKMQEEAHRLARASFQMRERVRQQTYRRSFDQMVLEAQLTASLGRMKL